MSSSQSNGQSFYLTNGPDTPPLIHAILSASSRTWQYVVVDPSTRHGVVIDPVYSRNGTDEDLPSDGTETIIRLIKQQGYVIDHILETESSSRPKLTAAWSLRMQLFITQGFPPQLCSNAPVSALQRMFSRKYGAANGFSTTLSKQHQDKDSFVVGRMRVTVIHAPGFNTPKRRAYLINGALFGAYSIAMPGADNPRGQRSGTDPVLSDVLWNDQHRQLWQSMQRILALPEETRVYHEEDVEGAGSSNYTTIEQCRAFNSYIDLNANEFIIRRRGELREQQDAIIAKSDHSRKRSKQVR